MKIKIAGLLMVFSVLLLTACERAEKAEAPKPRQPGADAVGYFCNMLLQEHKGPKSQVFLKGKQQPLWFTSVRDGIAYTRLPEESQGVSALYVTVVDSATEFDLEHPEQSSNTWIEAGWALYVIDSRLRGGMGAMEAFPFREGAEANQFTEMYGGRIVRLSEIPEDYVLGNSGTLPQSGQMPPMPEKHPDNHQM